MDHDSRLRAAQAHLRERLESQVTNMDPAVGPRSLNPSAGQSSNVGPLELEVPFSCRICFLAAWRPVVTSCGHLFCWPCLNSWLTTTGRSNCPTCSELVALTTESLFGFPVIPALATDESLHPAPGDSRIQPAANADEFTHAPLPERRLPERRLPERRLPERRLPNWRWAGLRPPRIGRRQAAQAGPLPLWFDWVGNITAMQFLQRVATTIHEGRLAHQVQAMRDRGCRDVAVGELIEENLHITEQILQSQRERQQRELNIVRGACNAQLRRMRSRHAAELRRLQNEHRAAN